MTNPTVPDTPEAQARARKAAAIARVLTDGYEALHTPVSARAAAARTLTPGERRLAAQIAGVRPASPTTWEVIYQLLSPNPGS